MNSFYISNIELFILFILIIVLVLPFNLINRNSRLAISHPLIFYSICMLYYTFFCPILQIAFNQTFNRGFDFRDQYILGWLGAFLSVSSVLIGYSVKTKVREKASKICNLNYESIWSIGLFLNLFGILIYMFYVGFDLSDFNPFYNKDISLDFLNYRGNLINYLLNTQDFLVTGSLMMFAASYSMKKKFPLTLFNIIISFSLFLNTGFRYRVLFLFLSIIIFILISDYRINKSTAISIGAFTIFFSLIFLTIIGQIRIYGQGFNFELLNLRNNFISEIISQGESRTFITTSGIINLIPDKLPFENFYPIYKTLIHPIPSNFFNKNSGDYLFKILNGVYGFKNIHQGAAYLNYGEYYLMFGWYGIFIFNFLLGYLFKRLWIWINLHKEEPLAIIIFILNVVFIFMIITRGYLPQQLHLYTFLLLPIFIIYSTNLKNKYNNN